MTDSPSTILVRSSLNLINNRAFAANSLVLRFRDIEVVAKDRGLISQIERRLTFLFFFLFLFY
jgi:hypothetical protein